MGAAGLVGSESDLAPNENSEDLVISEDLADGCDFPNEKLPPRDAASGSFSFSLDDA